GLPVETSEHIFEPYYLLSHKKTGQQGVGVGLSIVKKIIDELTASILVEKDKSGGTCFTISFKESKAVRPGEPVEIIPLTSPLPLVRGLINEKNISPEKPSLLVVDDNVQLLKLIRNTLDETYNIFLARDVEEAIVKLRTIPRPALIISDIMMAGPDGFSLLKDVSKMEEYSDIPFIFLTALGGEEAKLRGLGLGAVDYIEKPFIMTELTAKISSIIALRQRQEKREISFIHNKIEGVFSGFQKNSIQSHKPGFNALCEKYKITIREQKIIRLMLSGMIHKEIAFKLKISKRTVDYHLAKIYKKCGVINKYDLLNKFQG
ncbi:MAG: response regulator, partial [Spirochaetales bacterium]|nr:response regulator [Spirochaetales bacterium]